MPAAFACLLAGLIITAAGCGQGSAAAPGTLTGTSINTAIRVGSVGEERDILNKTTCDGGSFYRVARYHIEQKDGHFYDVVNAECVQGPQKRVFYFDVTSCFPCKN